MRRTVWLTLLLLLAPRLGAADDFTDLKKQYRLSFRAVAPAEERLKVVQGLSALKRKDSAVLLVSGMTVSQGIVDNMFERKKVVDQENNDLGGEYRHQKESQKLKELIDAELEVLQAIEAALLGMKTRKVMEYLGKDVLQKGKHWRSRLVAARALGEFKEPSTYKYLLKALADRDGRVQIVAAGIFAKLEIPEALEGLVKLLESKSWTVRAAAIDALGKIGERRAVGPLVEQIGEEDGRLLDDCTKVLEKLTGQNFGPIPESWRRWWKEHREEYEGEGDLPFGEHGEQRPKDDDQGYYGIPIVTRKAIFILDISHSMAYSMKDAQELPKRGEQSKMEAAKGQLKRTLSLFDSKGRFMAIAFNDRVLTWRKKMTPSTPEMKLDVKAFVEKLEPASTTNIYEAMETAFRLIGMGTSDKEYDLGADTIFLLSDGTPTKPDGRDDDWKKVLRAVAEWNQLKRVRIHAVGFSGHNIEFMTQLAEQNGGRYVKR